MADLVSGKASVSDLKIVSVEDLLDETLFHQSRNYWTKILGKNACWFLAQVVQSVVNYVARF
jgi:hypothetical protein